jgi:hypothetical protein
MKDTELEICGQNCNSKIKNININVMLGIFGNVSCAGRVADP